MLEPKPPTVLPLQNHNFQGYYRPRQETGIKLDLKMVFLILKISRGVVKMKRFPEAVTTKCTELFSVLHSSMDDLKMAGAEASLSGDFSQVTLFIDSCRKLQGFEEEFKMALNNFESKQKPNFQKKSRKRTRKSGGRLRVLLTGQVIEEPTIAETFVKTLRFFGLERVAKLNKRVSSAALVSRAAARGYQAQKSCEGWHITTHVNKHTATTMLKEIAGNLNIPIQIEFIER